MNVRFARREDKTQVLNLLDELSIEVAKADGKVPNHTPVLEAGDVLFDHLISDEKYKIFVAENNGKIFGLATVFLYPALRRGNYRAQLEEFIVTENSRGQGIGSQILEAVLKWCRENKIPSMRLNSGLNLKEAHKFYESNGGKFTQKMFKFDLE